MQLAETLAFLTAGALIFPASDEDEALEMPPSWDEFDRVFIHMMMDHHRDAKMQQRMLQDSLKAWYNEEHRSGDGPHM